MLCQVRTYCILLSNQHYRMMIWYLRRSYGVRRKLWDRVQRRPKLHDPIRKYWQTGGMIRSWKISEQSIDMIWTVQWLTVSRQSSIYVTFIDTVNNTSIISIIWQNSKLNGTNVYEIDQKSAKTKVKTFYAWSVTIPDVPRRLTHITLN